MAKHKPYWLEGAPKTGTGSKYMIDLHTYAKVTYPEQWDAFMKDKWDGFNETFLEFRERIVTEYDIGLESGTIQFNKNGSLSKSRKKTTLPN